jgi:hypothetical protein
MNIDLKISIKTDDTNFIRDIDLTTNFDLKYIKNETNVIDLSQINLKKEYNKNIDDSNLDIITNKSNWTMTGNQNSWSIKTISLNESNKELIIIIDTGILGYKLLFNNVIQNVSSSLPTGLNVSFNNTLQSFSNKINKDVLAFEKEKDTDILNKSNWTINIGYEVYFISNINFESNAAVNIYRTIILDIDSTAKNHNFNIIRKNNSAPFDTNLPTLTFSSSEFNNIDISNNFEKFLDNNNYTKDLLVDASNYSLTNADKDLMTIDGIEYIDGIEITINITISAICDLTITQLSLDSPIIDITSQLNNTTTINETECYDNDFSVLISYTGKFLPQVESIDDISLNLTSLKDQIILKSYKVLNNGVIEAIFYYKTAASLTDDTITAEIIANGFNVSNTKDTNIVFNEKINLELSSLTYKNIIDKKTFQETSIKDIILNMILNKTTSIPDSDIIIETTIITDTKNITKSLNMNNLLNKPFANINISFLKDCLFKDVITEDMSATIKAKYISNKTNKTYTSESLSINIPKLPAEPIFKNISNTIDLKNKTVSWQIEIEEYTKNLCSSLKTSIEYADGQNTSKEFNHNLSLDKSIINVIDNNIPDNLLERENLLYTVLSLKWVWSLSEIYNYKGELISNNEFIQKELGPSIDLGFSSVIENVNLNKLWNGTLEFEIKPANDTIEAADILIQIIEVSSSVLITEKSFKNIPLPTFNTHHFDSSLLKDNVEYRIRIVSTIVKAMGKPVIDEMPDIYESNKTITNNIQGNFEKHLSKSIYKIAYFSNIDVSKTKKILVNVEDESKIFDIFLKTDENKTVPIESNRWMPTELIQTSNTINIIVLFDPSINDMNFIKILTGKENVPFSKPMIISSEKELTDKDVTISIVSIGETEKIEYEIIDLKEE